MQVLEEIVIKLDLGYEPEAAVSGAFLTQDENRAFLTFNAMRLNENKLYEEAGTAVVEIVRCSITKFGYPNDEAQGGHPLYHKGLDNYGIYEVLNSSWISEQKKQNLVCFPDRTDFSWKRHFIFCFHDSTFECLAEALKLEISEEPFEQILQKLTKKFLGDF